MCTKNEEREFIIECIRLYKELQCLWNLKNKEYYDRSKKNEAYVTLLTKYRQAYPTATKNDLKRKINSLRTNYRKELKKYLELVKSGNTYEPTLWYYKDMKFLEDLESGSVLKCDLQSSQKYESFSDNRNIVDDTDTSTSNDSTDHKQTNTRKRKAENGEIQMKTYKNHKEEETEYDNWGKVWARDLQKMDPIQQIFAKKAISDIMMEGQLGLLHRDSIKLNQRPDLLIHASNHHPRSPISAPKPYIDYSHSCLRQTNQHGSPLLQK